jgi:two-component system sensor histidine kinase/response regulator
VLHALSGALASTRSSRPPEREAKTRPQALQGRTILVVQDSAVTRDFAREVLEGAGAKIELAVDGAEAVARTTRDDFDLVLMDLHLPVLDGVAATRAIRAGARSCRTPILAFSASVRPEDRERCLAAGMTGFIAAPVGAAELVDAVVRCLHVNPSGTFNAVTAATLAAAMDSPRPAAQGVLDAVTALSRLGGDAALYRRLLKRFASSHLNSARDVQRALAAADFDGAALIVHTLSSAAANIGAAALQAAAQALEHALERRKLETIDGLLADFELTEQATQAAVSAALDAQPPSSTRYVEPTPPGKLVARLRALLDDNDTAAVDGLEQLRQVFAGHSAAAEAFQRLEASVNAYDFAQARSHLDTFESWLASRDGDSDSDSDSDSDGDGQADTQGDSQSQSDSQSEVRK